MFDTYPTYSYFRALKLREPLIQGEDVYAWQTALRWLDGDVATDGVFGPQTDATTKRVQAKLGVMNDGIVGPVTWVKAVDNIGRSVRRRVGVPAGAIYGQVNRESGFRGGAYSGQRPNGSYDVGVAQRNTDVYPAVRASFDVPFALNFLAEYIVAYYQKFKGVPEQRRWDLAQGAWNAPAFACWYARAEGAVQVPRGDCAEPRGEAKATFDEYIADVTAYRR